MAVPSEGEIKVFAVCLRIIMHYAAGAGAQGWGGAFGRRRMRLPRPRREARGRAALRAAKRPAPPLGLRLSLSVLRAERAKRLRRA